MLPNKKIILTITVTLVLFTSFSGCVIQDLLFGTSFSLITTDVIDDDGFPALSIKYSCTGMVTLKLYNPNSQVVDNDFFFRGESSTILNLGSYKQSLTNGNYVLKAYNKDNNEISSNPFSFYGPDLSIISCEQKLWDNEDEIILLGVSLYVKNNGDVPVYPYEININIGSNSVSGLILPVCIPPTESKTINCSVYKKDVPEEPFIITIKDIDGIILATGTFVDIQKKYVSTKSFTKGLEKTLNVPYPEFLFDYYSGLDRITEEYGEDDYSVYVFDPYDDTYLDIFIDCLISTLSFNKLSGEFVYNTMSDEEKINFVAKFVQHLEYREDDINNESVEYPSYPIQTLFDDSIGCDCEDKAILTASLLDKLNFSVSLFRLPNHMAVGVKLGKNALPEYKYYVNDYYFLETTTEDAPVGYIPSLYSSTSGLYIYQISSRPYLIHNWKNEVITIYTNTDIGDVVKVVSIIENHGRSTAANVQFKGLFNSSYGIELEQQSVNISSLEPGTKKKVVLSVDIPSMYTTTFETRIYLNGKIVDTKISDSEFS